MKDFLINKILTPKFFRIFSIILVIIVLLTVSLLTFYLSYLLKQEKNSIVSNNNVSKTLPPKKEINDWVLVINKINISVPIILNVNGTDKEAYFAALQNGVAQMLGTALPGEGNTVIFGHSNFYDDDPGQYKQIFSTLDQLMIGDEIQIQSKEKILNYIVHETELVDPSAVEVINPTDNKQLTLITCWPPGTIEQRLVIIANLQ